MTGTISISKTTGRGKAVGLIHFHVASKAWLVEPTWLADGLGILQRATEAQSFLLPLVTHDGASFSTQEPNFAEMTIIDRQLLSSATGLAFKRDDALACGYSFEAKDAKLLKPGVQQHSDFRLFLVTFVITTCYSEQKPGERF